MKITASLAVSIAVLVIAMPRMSYAEDSPSDSNCPKHLHQRTVAQVLNAHLAAFQSGDAQLCSVRARLFNHAGSGQHQGRQSTQRLPAHGAFQSPTRRIPSFEVADALPIEYGTAHLQQRIGIGLALPPTHVPVPFHALADHIVNHRLGAGTGDRVVSGHTVARS
jgi:hypothetical protein